MPASRVPSANPLAISATGQIHEPQGDVWQLGQHTRQFGQQHPLDDAVARGQRELDSFIRALLFEVAQAEQLLPSERVQAPASFSERHATPAPTHQFDAEELLKLLDLPAEKTLTRRITLGCLGDTARLCHTAEALQPIQRQAALLEQVINHDWTVITHAVIRLEETGGW
jgi:hypothetical protein